MVPGSRQSLRLRPCPCPVSPICITTPLHPLPPSRSRPSPAASRARSRLGLCGDAGRLVLTSPRAEAAAAVAGPWWAEACGCAFRRARVPWRWVGVMPLVSMEWGQAPRLRRPYAECKQRLTGGPARTRVLHHRALRYAALTERLHAKGALPLRRESRRPGCDTHMCSGGWLRGQAARAGAPRDGRKIKGTKKEGKCCRQSE